MIFSRISRLAAFSLFVGLFVGCNPTSGDADPVIDSPLKTLLFDAEALHESLEATDPETTREVPSGISWTTNPSLSMDRPFIEGVARGGSQGNLDGTGMRAALYARYQSGTKEIGFYGLEAESTAVADKREKAIREIWAHNESLDRTHVYRKGNVLLVVWLWTDEELPECWEATKRIVQKRFD
ncbi:MAG: hypothetical protein AAFU85_25425 [Planctomycetota bacterium]